MEYNGIIAIRHADFVIGFKGEKKRFLDLALN